MKVVHIRSWRAAAALVLAALLTACANLPDTGPVHSRRDAKASSQQVPYFVPPGPVLGENPEDVGRGFLLAMRANPPSTAIARSFLSDHAKGTWNPSLGTVLYDATAIQARGSTVITKLSDAHALDSRGGWLAGASGQTKTLQMHVVKQDGYWRIIDPPDALIVPTSYFSSLFVPFNLYFFDQTHRVLVPDTVYLPSGEQTATNLVRGLLQGPSVTLANVINSAFPPSTGLDLGVVVSDSGIAEVPLSAGIRQLSPSELSRAVAQLASTLRQVPGIDRVRVTVDGAPVTLPGGRADVSVNEGSEYASGPPVGSDALAIQAGRVVRLAGVDAKPIAGPLGGSGFSLRSLSVDASTESVAAVSGSGTRVFVSHDRGPRRGPVRTVFEGGHDLLRPAYDMFDSLWLVDRAPSGARVYVVQGSRTEEVRVPGVTGRRLSAFAITDDGTRLVATDAAGPNPIVRMANIVRGQKGRVLRCTTPRALRVTGGDFGPALDVGLVEPTTLAVLTRSSAKQGRVIFLALDGSPSSDTSSPPEAVPANSVFLVASPVSGVPFRLITTDGRLRRQNASGQWVGSTYTGVLAAAYPQ